MALKSFEIDFNGKKETIEYEDDIPFGTMERIIRASVDLSDLTRPRINIPEYRMGVTLAAIKKAPFDHKKTEGLKQLGRKTAEKIVSGVMKDYPLESSLEGWMTSLLGLKQESKSSMPSMDIVHSDSDGPKKKQTNVEVNSSKKS